MYKNRNSRSNNNNSNFFDVSVQFIWFSLYFLCGLWLCVHVHHLSVFVCQTIIVSQWSQNVRSINFIVGCGCCCWCLHSISLYGIVDCLLFAIWVPSEMNILICRRTRYGHILHLYCFPSAHINYARSI